MKNVLTKTSLRQYACVIVCYLFSGFSALYAMTSDESMTGTATNKLGISAEEEQKVRQAIARAPEVILSQEEDISAYVDEVCKMIARFPDPVIRRQYYRAFMDSACTTHFEKIEADVPFEKPDEDPDFRHYDRNCEIDRLRSFAWHRLEKVAEDIWTQLFAYDPVTSTVGEQFNSWFKFVEKMKAEKRRLGDSPLPYLDDRIRHLEYLFNFIYPGSPRAILNPQDRADFEARFKQVVGRPIRSAEQYREDARRRVEAFQKAREKEKEDLRKGKVIQEGSNGDRK